jgi:hypothetical protein
MELSEESVCTSDVYNFFFNFFFLFGYSYLLLFVLVLLESFLRFFINIKKVIFALFAWNANAYICLLC